MIKGWKSMEECFQRGVIMRVDLEGLDLCTQGAKPVAGMVEAVGVTASEQQVCALCCCTLGNPQANAGTTANDENVFVCK